MGIRMKISKRQLRRIIKEEISNIMSEGTLYFTRNRFGGVSVEDEDGEYIGTGEMVRSLLDAGIQDFTSEKGLAAMLKSDAEGVQGGLERWDSDVFPEYYGVDINALVQLYAKQKGMQVEEVEELEADW
jgi:transcriptional/translational regulatory protein YebC/TACO1